MAVQILNDMPDAAVHRGDPPALRSTASLSDWTPRAVAASSSNGRPLFAAITVGIHVLAGIAFLSIRQVSRVEAPPTPIVAQILEAPSDAEQAPAVTPPMQKIEYVLPPPDQLSIEVDTITPPPTTVASAAITPNVTRTVAPPMIESVEYVRAPAPVYPRESSRRRESGTVLLRVLVDVSGRPSQIQVERSSGFERLDVAARDAVMKAMFRPHEVNGVAQPAQVLIPIEFTRRAS